MSKKVQIAQKIFYFVTNEVVRGRCGESFWLAFGAMGQKPYFCRVKV